MFRTHNCGELRISNVGENVTLSGWVDKGRDLGGLTFIDLRDRYGITQLVFNMDINPELCEQARKLGREYVIKVSGEVSERSAKNKDRSTGDIEINVQTLDILSKSEVPPFTIEKDTDGGEELRMKYRYLDLRRPNIQSNIIFRSKLAQEVRNYLTKEDFVEVETPFLIKSTPEGARDFIVPSRMNPGQSYALPQSPQTFKQLLMIAGIDKYFQIVKCFRDEDLRADRQPEFTQIDCEMSYVTQEEILNTFEGLTQTIFENILQIDLGDFPRMSYDDAMRLYGSDKPDTRFEMQFVELNADTQNKGFQVFDQAELVVGINAEGQADKFSNKDIKKLTEWVKRPQIGAKGLVYIKWNHDDSVKSSVSKFYTDEQLRKILQHASAKPGDMLLILSGEKDATRKQLGALRLEMAERMQLIKSDEFSPLWVVDFPLLEWDEDDQRYYAMHHPFTSPKSEDLEKMASSDKVVLGSIRADAYDLVINGVEIGGGSIRIYDKELQKRNFDLLGFSEEEAEEQFGFLMGAFKYGAPPHGGIAYGFDRLCAVMAGQNSIRDFIAFPKNNQGRDVMIDAPSAIEPEQLDELGLALSPQQKEN